MYHEKFGQLVTSLKNLQARVPEVQIQNLRRLAQVIEKQGTEVKPTYRRFFNMAANLLTSLADGIASGDVGPRDYIKIIDEMDGYANAVEELEKNPEKDRKTSLPPDFLEQMKSQSVESIKKYSAFKQMVPEFPTARLTVKQLPVVALTDPFMFPEKLANLKLAKDFIFGYPVLEKQLVAGLKNDWLAEEYRNNLDEAIGDVLGQVKERTGKEYVQLGEPHRLGNVTWVWLVNSMMLQKLNKASAGGHFKLKSWAFPFEPKKFEPKDPRSIEKIKKLMDPIWDHKKNPFVEKQGRTI